MKVNARSKRLARQRWIARLCLHPATKWDRLAFAKDLNSTREVKELARADDSVLKPALFSQDAPLLRESPISAPPWLRCEQTRENPLVRQSPAVRSSLCLKTKI